MHLQQVAHFEHLVRGVFAASPEAGVSLVELRVFILVLDRVRQSGLVQRDLAFEEERLERGAEGAFLAKLIAHAVDSGAGRRAVVARQNSCKQSHINAGYCHRLIQI